MRGRRGPGCCGGCPPAVGPSRASLVPSFFTWKMRLVGVKAGESAGGPAGCSEDD